MSQFDFQQFSVSQSACAMKVGTDGVLLGAWTDVSHAHNIWDVGCGTGLLALMLAQRTVTSHITAIEIDPAAAAQAAINVAASPWKERIDVVDGDICQVAQKLPVPDLIICNPPFFTQSLLPPDKARINARHDLSLSLRNLMHISSKALVADGTLAIIVPAGRKEEAIEEALFSGLDTWRITEVRTNPQRPPKRILMQFYRPGGIRSFNYDIQDRSIHTVGAQYSQWYQHLTHDFYLK